ncbi:hypothetical protein VIBRN418_06306 [Vibrio sp. N418]|uniref:Uncharacterized protein n=1 Tax=Vibrio scophthalmi LMG 19158 TaxID=870967 RepID=F9RQA3_9VIBR|nr:hypothetical protein VIBRN418_06306 [Vibrio sp. N418]EGU34569.1 hypothetical protein VIS19158_13262 [Vibrio scophthalmi LMG 19158]
MQQKLISSPYLLGAIYSSEPQQDGDVTATLWLIEHQARYFQKGK